MRLVTLLIVISIAACDTPPATRDISATPTSEVLSPIATFVMTPQAHYSPPEPPDCAADISFVAKMTDGPVVLYQPEQDPVVLQDTMGEGFSSFFHYSPDGRFVLNGFAPVTVYDAQTGISTIILDDTSPRTILWNARNHLLIDTRSTVDDGTVLYNPFNDTITRLYRETLFGEFLFFHGWSGDGRYLYHERVTGTSFQDRREWIIYDDDTRQHHILLTETHPEDELWALFINWSPDFRHAVLRFSKRGADDKVYEQTHYLMGTTDFSISPLETMDGTTNYIWMGDNSGILYLDGDTRMMRYDLATQNSTPFYESDTFHLYPGFVRNDTHWIARYTVELDENDEEVLTFHSFQRVAYDGTPLDTIAFSDVGAWEIGISPDGSTIAYSTNRVFYETGPIHLYDVETGETTVLEGDFYRSFEWIHDKILTYKSTDDESPRFYDATTGETCVFPDDFRTVDLRFPKDN